MKVIKSNLYYIYIAIATFVFYMRYFNFEYRVIDYAIYFLAFLSLIIYALYWIYEQFTVKERIIHIVLLSSIFLVYYLSGMQYEYLIFTSLAIIGIKGKSIKKIMLITFYVYIVCLFSHILLLITGVIKDEVFIKISSGKEVVTHKLGFPHGNAAFTIAFTLICSYVYCKFEKIKIWNLIIIEIISIGLYFLFHARTGLIIISALIVGTAIFKYTKNKENIILKVIRVLETFVVPVMFVGSYLLSTLLYNTKISTMINEIISNRVKISNIYFQDVPPGLFPNNFKLIEDNPFDNMYSFIMSAFGIIFAIIVSILFVTLCIKLIKRKRYFELYIITLFALYSYAERMYINSFRNPSILFLGVLLYKNFEMFDCEEKDEKHCNNLLLFWKTKKRL